MAAAESTGKAFAGVNDAGVRPFFTFRREVVPLASAYVHENAAQADGSEKSGTIMKKSADAAMSSATSSAHGARVEGVRRFRIIALDRRGTTESYRTYWLRDIAREAKQTRTQMPFTPYVSFCGRVFFL